MKTPTTPAPTQADLQANASLREPAQADWFYDELMTPQPDATQAFLRARLKHLTKTLPVGDREPDNTAK